MSKLILIKTILPFHHKLKLTNKELIKKRKEKISKKNVKLNKSFIKKKKTIYLLYYKEKRTITDINCIYVHKK